VIAGLLTFLGYSLIARLSNPVLWFDGGGLAFFAVAGTHKALVCSLNPVMAALLGMLTGIGGGMLRDVLVAEIPTVLRADLYALAALACAVVVAIAGGILCFSLRFMAIRHWLAPAGGPPTESPEC
jgi:uncharacterized membrane protein YeiH